MHPHKVFNFCPKCGQPRSEPPRNPFKCEACGLLYYFNPAIAAAAFVLRPDGSALFIRRAKDPAKGKFAIPGGFIDIGETAENALQREIREEVNLTTASIEYFCSFTNEYLYCDVNYPVLDLFFIARIDGTERLEALDDVESICWLDPSQVKLEDIAFPSIRNALQLLRDRTTSRASR
jgi:ADP-ribose pyrophosphatase YjhB (NUDIX family)